MSRITRGIFDSLRIRGLPAANLPYNNAEWWDKCYDTLDGRVQEWGDFGFNELLYHSYCSSEESYWLTQFKNELKKACLGDTDLAGSAYLNDKGEHGNLLILGGGTSNLSGQIHEAGWKNVIDIDFSQNVIDQNIEKYKNTFPELQFECIDARSMRLKSFQKNLKFANTKFNVCLDKGLVDGLWCSGTEATKQIPLVSQSVASVLVPGGRFLTLSYTSPMILKPLLLDNGIQMNNQTNTATTDNNNKNQFHDLLLSKKNKNDSMKSMWKSIECRKLSSVYFYILERNEIEYREPPDMMSDMMDNDQEKWENWRKSQRQSRKQRKNK